MSGLGPNTENVLNLWTTSLKLSWDSLNRQLGCVEMVKLISLRNRKGSVHVMLSLPRLNHRLRRAKPILFFRNLCFRTTLSERRHIDQSNYRYHWRNYDRGRNPYCPRLLHICTSVYPKSIWRRRESDVPSEESLRGKGMPLPSISTSRYTTQRARKFLPRPASGNNGERFQDLRHDALLLARGELWKHGKRQHL